MDFCPGATMEPTGKRAPAFLRVTGTPPRQIRALQAPSAAVLHRTASPPGRHTVTSSGARGGEEDLRLNGGAVLRSPARLRIERRAGWSASLAAGIGRRGRERRAHPGPRVEYRKLQGFICKVVERNVFPFRRGVRIEYEELQGLFCKNTDDVRPEAIGALLVGKDYLNKGRRKRNYITIKNSLHLEIFYI